LLEVVDRQPEIPVAARNRAHLVEVTNHQPFTRTGVAVLSALEQTPVVEM
jgi:hypothetical protein